MLNSPSLVNFVHIKRIVLKNNGYLLLLKFAILCRLIIFSILIAQLLIMTSFFVMSYLA